MNGWLAPLDAVIKHALYRRRRNKDRHVWIAKNLDRYLGYQRRYNAQQRKKRGHR